MNERHECQQAWGLSKIEEHTPLSFRMSTSSGRKLKLIQDLILIAAAVSQGSPISIDSTILRSRIDGRPNTHPWSQQVSAYYLVRYVLSRLDPEADRKEEARKKSAAVLRRLDVGATEEQRDQSSQRPRKEDLVLSQYEQAIALEVVPPEDIPVTFEGTSCEPAGHCTCLLIGLT